jgi:hypothetical protein
MSNFSTSNITPLDIANPGTVVAEPIVTLYFGSNDYSWNLSAIQGQSFDTLLRNSGSVLGMEYNRSKTSIRREDYEDSGDGDDVIVNLDSIVEPGSYILNVSTDSKG